MSRTSSTRTSYEVDLDDEFKPPSLTQASPSSARAKSPSARIGRGSSLDDVNAPTGEDDFDETRVSLDGDGDGYYSPDGVHSEWTKLWNHGLKVTNTFFDRRSRVASIDM
jgi:hypothetical protein